MKAEKVLQLLIQCESSAQIQSLAKKAGKSVAEVEKKWDEIKAGLLKSGVKETDDKFYPVLVSTLKKAYDITENQNPLQLTPKITYYVDKFGMKMKGSTKQTAQGWVDGIGDLGPLEKRALWKAIEDKYY